MGLKNSHLVGWSFSLSTWSCKSIVQSLFKCSFRVAAKMMTSIKIDNTPQELQVTQTSFHKALKCHQSICQP